MLKYKDKDGILTSIVKYSDLYIEEVLEYGDKTLCFSIPVIYAENILLENYILTKTDEYVIKQKNTDDAGNYVITAKLNIDELEGSLFQSFETEEKTAVDTANLALAGTGGLCECEVLKKRTIRLTNVSVWEILKKIADTFILEMQIDSVNKRIIFKEKIGEDKGVYFADQLNLISLEMQSNTSDFYTRLLPLGKDGLTIENVNDGKKYVENYTYSSKVKTFLWKDDRYTDAQSLKDDAAAKLADMAQPYTAYSCKIFDMAQYSNLYKEFFIGDTVTIINKETKTRIQQRIVKIRRYPDNHSNDTCEISNLKLTFDEYIQKYNDTSNTVNNITVDNGTVDGDSINNIDASKILRLDEVIAENAKFNEVSAELLNVTKQLNAANAKIGTLETTKISATEADLKYASIDKVDGIEGKFETFYSHEFTSAVSSIGDLTVSVEKVNTLIFGSASGGSLTTEFSNSVVAMIGDAQIKSAMIQEIDADKIKSGKLYTDFVEVCSQSGNLNIKDNTVQIRDDAGTARVQIGKDAGGDYNIYIWDKDGKLMFDPLYGLCEAGIKQPVIRNDMVSDDADISAKKINVSSLFDVINSDGSHTLTASKIYVDADNQTLDIAFKNMTTTVSETAASVSDAVETANAANTNASSALNKVSSVEANLKTISQTVSSQGTQLSTVQGQISSKIWQQDITTAVSEIQIGARNLQKNTEFKVNLANWSVGTGYTRDTAKQFEGANTVKFTRTGLSANSNSHFFSGNKAIQIEVGQTVTASANFYTDDVSLIDGNKAFIGIFFYNSSGAAIAASQTKISFTDGKWVKCSHTATAPENTVYAAICITTSRNGTYYIGKPMFEKGNKATDWSPAPEDTDSSISSLEGTVTTLNNQYTSLNQSLTSLTATVNSNTTAISQKADGSSVTALDNKITEITASLDGFKSTVSSSYATKTELNLKKDNTYATFYGLGNTAGYCYLCRLKINAASVNTDITIGITQRFKGYSEAYIRFANTTGKDPAVERFDKMGASIWYIFKAAAGTWDIYVKKSVPYDAIIVDNYLNHVSVSCEWKCVNCDAVSGWSEAKQLAAQYGVDTTTGGVNGSGNLITSGAVYNTTVNTNTKIEQTKSSILSTVSSTYATQEQVADVNAKFTDYSTTVQMNSAIEQKAASITQSVSSTYATKSSLGNYATTASVTASLALKIDKTDNNQIVSMINASANEINLKSDRFSLSSSNATISKNGTVMFKAGTIGSWNITSNSLYSDYNVYRSYIQTAKSADTWVFSAQEKRDGAYYGNWYVTASGEMYALNKFIIDASGKETGSYILMEEQFGTSDKYQTRTSGLEYYAYNLTNGNYFNAQPEGIWFGNDKESTSRGSITKDSNNKMHTSFHVYKTKNENGVIKGWFNDTAFVMQDGWNNNAIYADWNGNFSCTGTKNRIVETDNFGQVKMNAFETAGAHFADVVSGKIAADGKCVIYLDRKFAETIDRDCEYQVILTAVGKSSELYVIKDEEYFTVYGQPETDFDCMIIGRQKGYVTSYADNADFSGLGEEVSDNVIN